MSSTARTHVVQVRRPRAVVFDILGTASKSGFLEKILFPYLKMNLDNYVNANWHNPDFMHVYKQIVAQSNEFKAQEPTTPVVVPHDDANAKTSLMKFIEFVNDNNLNAPSVTRLRFKVWFEGYQQAKIRTPIYSDVPERMKKWFSEGIKFNVFSNTWVEAQKALLRNTNHGDLTNLISGYYDNEFGSLTEPDSWRRLCVQINEAPRDVLFLTKAPIEGRAAAEAGLSVVLVLTHRHNVRAVSREDRIRFPYVRTLLELTWLEEKTTAAVPSVDPSQKKSIHTAASSATTYHAAGQSAAPMGTTTSTATNTGHSTVLPSNTQERSTSKKRSTSRGRSRINAPSASSTAASASGTPVSSATNAASSSAAPSSSATRASSTAGGQASTTASKQQ